MGEGYSGGWLGTIWSTACLLDQITYVILVGDSKKLEKYTSNTHVWLGTMKAKKINALLPTIVCFIVYIL